MSLGLSTADIVRQRMRSIWSGGQFAYQTMLAPWPPFLFYFLVVVVAGAITPLVQIRATGGLIDTLAARLQAPDAATEGLALLAPYTGWLLVLIGALVLGRVIYFDPFQEYLAARLNERVKERFDGLFFTKALAVRLEQFDQAGFYDRLQRARQAMGSAQPSRHLVMFQTLVLALTRCAAILVALAAAHPLVPLMLLGGSGLLIRQELRRQRAIIVTAEAQTPLKRRAAYWYSLLTRRETAAEVRLFGLAGHIVAAWRTLTHDLLREIIMVRHRKRRREVALAVLVVGLNGVVALALVGAAARGRLSPGALVALLFALQQYLDQLNRISNRIRWLWQYAAELGHVADLLRMQDEEPSTGKPAPTLLQDGIHFTEVGFTYPSGQIALANINLHIKPGERIALVGENGAGKSTLVRLLLGLYRPTSGTITVDGHDLQTLDPATWRATTGAVLQDYGRYAFTVRENIGLGRVERIDDQQAVVVAARKSGADMLVKGLPQGYDTLLGKDFDGGHDLSQGQWQKLAIARAYFRNAELLVLDEPTAALDARSELEVYRQFLNLAAVKTVVLISHRLGSARLADRIVLLHAGRISETGTHAELIAAGDRYASLYALQAEWYRDQGTDAGVPAMEQ